MNIRGWDTEKDLIEGPRFNDSGRKKQIRGKKLVPEECKFCNAMYMKFNNT